jgi:hypothetical protein
LFRATFPARFCRKFADTFVAALATICGNDHENFSQESIGIRFPGSISVYLLCTPRIEDVTIWIIWLLTAILPSAEYSRKIVWAGTVEVE